MPTLFTPVVVSQEPSTLGNYVPMPSGGSLDSVLLTSPLINENGGNINLGEPCYITPSGGVDKACADSKARCSSIVFPIENNIPTTQSRRYQVGGVVKSSTPLVAGKVYFLSASLPGAMIADDAPPLPGEVVRLGFAINTTDFVIQVER